jgi:C-5 ketoreductase
VNVRSPFFVTQRALPRLGDGGRIVFLSSAVTRIASPFAHYAMTKAAVEALARTLANALGPRGITVNAVAPGVVDTDMGAWLDSGPSLREAVASTVALGRIAQAPDIADVVAFLVSHDGRWVTGQTIEASGGQWLGPLAG